MKNHRYALLFSQQCLLNLLKLCLIALLVIPDLSYAVSKSDFNLPAQNINGWTVLSPELDSRIVYVDSSSGNDSTGQVYSSSDNAVGSNPQSPSEAIQAYKTLAAAHAQLRHDKPDWMLLKSGQAWEESLPIHRGESATKRAVISSYEPGDRPELRTGAQRGIASLEISNIIISGIKFWAHTRDTDGPYFQSYEGSSGFFFLTRPVGDRRTVSDVLIEDCFFRAYERNGVSGALNTHTANNSPVTRVTIRRSIISGNYSVSSHSSGVYHAASGQPATIPASVLLEENIFDHNGWRIHSINSDNNPADGQATFFSHNTYFADSKKVMFVNNIFMRPSSMQNKWTANEGSQSSHEIVVENNFYIEGEIGLGAGGNKPGSHRFSQFKFNDNVLTDIGRDQPTNRNLAWYLDINDWDSGEITGNLLLNQTADITNTYAINFTAPDGTQQISVKDNYIYNMESSRPLLNFFDGDNTSSVSFSDNVVQAPANGPIAEIDAKGGYQFNGDNGYFSNGNASEWFIINGNGASLSEWINYTGDSNAAAEPPNWVDPDRNIERYADELGLGNSFNNFINALYSQSKSNWRSDLTASEINDWFRAGFIIDSLDTDNDGVLDADDNCTLIANTNQRDTDEDGYGNWCDGDLNNDGNTNTLDLNLYKLSHRTSQGDANYNPHADFNGDGGINTLDLNIYKTLHRKPPGPSCCVLPNQ